MPQIHPKKATGGLVVQSKGAGGCVGGGHLRCCAIPPAASKKIKKN
jgi:hypothetical protein